MRGKTRIGLDASQISTPVKKWIEKGDARNESPAPVMRLAIEAIQVS
jgi:hypothetical protein